MDSAQQEHKERSSFWLGRGLRNFFWVGELRVPPKAGGPTDEGSPKKIVVSVWPGIGDIIFATPVFRTLRTKFPNSWITALIWSIQGKEILKYNPYINEIIYAPLIRASSLISKLRGYDVGIQCSQPVQLLFWLSGIKKRTSFNGNPFWWLYPVDHNNFHSTEYYLQAVGKITSQSPPSSTHTPINWEIFWSEKDEIIAQNAIKNARHPFIAIHPGARNNKCKRWEPANFISLCNSLTTQFNAQIILIGGKKEIKLCNYISEGIYPTPLNLAGKLTLLQSAAVINRCDLFIGHASGPTYIAAAVRTPVVAIYGPDDPKNFGLLGEKVTIITPKLKCAPCLHFYRNFIWGLIVRYIPKCKAIQSIKPDDVFNACIQSLL